MPSPVAGGEHQPDQQQHAGVQQPDDARPRPVRHDVVGDVKGQGVELGGVGGECAQFLSRRIGAVQGVQRIGLGSSQPRGDACVEDRAGRVREKHGINTVAQAMPSRISSVRTIAVVKPDSGSSASGKPITAAVMPAMR